MLRACPCSPTRSAFETIGYEFNHEFVRRGILIETADDIQIRAMQCFASSKEAQSSPDSTLVTATSKKTKIAAPWLLELSGNGKTPEVRDAVKKSLYSVMGGLKGIARVVFPNRGNKGDPIKYSIMG